MDTLMGLADQTKEAYFKDLLQFKAYLVVHRKHLISRGDLDRLDEFRDELRRSDGKLVDTTTSVRRFRNQLRSRALLDTYDLDLRALRKEDIVAYFAYLESVRGLARSTLLRRMASLRRYLSLLVKEDYPIATEVLDRLDEFQLKKERRLPIALSRDEAIDFIATIKNARDRAMVLVMVFMGLRISEVVQLNVDDITPYTEGITFRGKGGKERYVPVHPTARDAVLIYKAERPEVEPDELGEPLFVSRHRRRIDASTVRRFIKKYAKEALSLDNRKRQKLSPHKLRHTFATLLLQGDVDIRYIQELLGHENLSTTEIYTSVNQEDLGRAIDRHPLNLD